MTEISANPIELWESKHRYDADFVNVFEEIPEGTRYTVLADIRLKGVARLLSPLLNRYIRQQITRYVLVPMKVAAEMNEAPCTRDITGAPNMISVRLRYCLCSCPCLIHPAIQQRQKYY